MSIYRISTYEAQAYHPSAPCTVTTLLNLSASTTPREIVESFRKAAIDYWAKRGFEPTNAADIIVFPTECEEV